MATRSSSDMATRSRTCSKRLGSQRRSAFLRTIIPKSLPCRLAMHHSCCGCIIRFDKRRQKFLCREILLLLDPDPDGKSRLHIERRKPKQPFYSFALGFVVSGRAVLFKRTMRKRRTGRRLFQESWPVRFEGFPASPHAQSKREEDETYRASPEFAKLNCYRRVAGSSRRGRSRC